MFISYTSMMYLCWGQLQFYVLGEAGHENVAGPETREGKEVVKEGKYTTTLDNRRTKHIK